MNAPAHNVMNALRRFVALRSAWRRGLALEPLDLERGSRARHEVGSGEPCVRGRSHDQGLRCEATGDGSGSVARDVTTTPGCRPCCCHV